MLTGDLPHKHNGRALRTRQIALRKTGVML